MRYYWITDTVLTLTLIITVLFPFWVLLHKEEKRIMSRQTLDFIEGGVYGAIGAVSFTAGVWIMCHFSDTMKFYLASVILNM